MLLSFFIFCKITDNFRKKSLSPLLIEKKGLTLLKRELIPYIIYLSAKEKIYKNINSLINTTYESEKSLYLW